MKETVKHTHTQYACGQPITKNEGWPLSRKKQIINFSVFVISQFMGLTQSRQPKNPGSN